MPFFFLPEQAQQQQIDKVKRCTITVPAEFDQHQRNATLFAAQLAFQNMSINLKNIDLLNEQIAKFKPKYAFSSIPESIIGAKYLSLEEICSNKENRQPVLICC